MPELPEVETVRRGLEPAMTGKTLTHVATHREGLRIPFPADLKSSIEGRKVSHLSRRAKYILVHFQGKGAPIMVIHLGMSGHMTIVDDLAQYKPKKHDHMILTMTGGSGVVFNDARRFGMVFLTSDVDIGDHPAFRSLGPEPLEAAFTGKVLREKLDGKKTAIKLALLDQRVVSGIGNIYACEALFEAGISPKKASSAISAAKCAELVKAIKSVLNRSIKAGGSTLKDYRHADGNLGYFQHSFLVYDREGEPCPRCPAGGKKAHTIHRITQSGRSTFYCPACQK